MDKRLEICFMIDFYGQMLTKKQYEIMNLYYNNDYSLTEISEIQRITRQAVSDTKRRSLDILINYENKLNLVKRFVKVNKLIKESIESLEKIKDTKLTENSNYIINDVKINLSKIIKEF